MTTSDLFSGLLTIFIILAIFILGYCAITHKSLTEFFKELKDIIITKKEEVIKK
jgi:hypothetical protein